MSEFPDWVEDEVIGWEELTPERAREIHRRLDDGSLQREREERMRKRRARTQAEVDALPFWRRVLHYMANP